MTPDEMARIHAAAMTVQPPWGAPTMRDLMAGPGAVVCVVTNAFALGRVVLDEAELLTLAVDPNYQRQGLGRVCLAAFEAEARRRGAVRAFLEVAESNVGAIGLYTRADWSPDGRRKGYYRAPGHPPVDAILMSKRLCDA